MQLNERQKKHLRGLAHKLRPVVMVGQHGLRETVLDEVEQALTAHELIKVKVSIGDREDRDEIIQSICDETRAILIQRVGNIATLFRRNNKKPKIDLKISV